VGMVMLAIVLVVLETTSRAEKAFSGLTSGRGRFGGAA
jgi:hypothetical protein